MTQTQRFFRLLFLLVFITVCVCGVNGSVWQTPSSVTVAAGERVDITCYFSVEVSRRGHWRIEWRKNNNTVIQNTSYNVSGSSPVNGSHTLTLYSVSVNHSGVYSCAAWEEVPQLGQRISAEGTELVVYSTITHNVTHTVTDQTVRWVALCASVLFIVCVASVICCFTHTGSRVGRRKRDNQSEQVSDTGVVYAAVKLHKPRKKRNTPAVSDVPDAGSSEVLYSEIQIKS